MRPAQRNIILAAIGGRSVRDAQQGLELFPYISSLYRLAEVLYLWRRSRDLRKNFWTAGALALARHQ